MVVQSDYSKQSDSEAIRSSRYEFWAKHTFKKKTVYNYHHFSVSEVRTNQQKAEYNKLQVLCFQQNEEAKEEERAQQQKTLERLGEL